MGRVLKEGQSTHLPSQIHKQRDDVRSQSGDCVGNTLTISLVEGIGVIGIGSGGLEGAVKGVEGTDNGEGLVGGAGVGGNVVGEGRDVAGDGRD